jgi:hypothetical protein
MPAAIFPFLYRNLTKNVGPILKKEDWSYRTRGYNFLFFSHRTYGKPIPYLPIPRSNNANRIFLVRELGWVPAMIDSRVIDSRVIGSDGGTSARGIDCIRDSPGIKFCAMDFCS